MAINLGDNIKIQSNLPIDYRYFNNLVPYTSTGQVDSTIPEGERYIGLTVNINNVEYWYATGVTNSNLRLKINAGTLNAAANGLSLSGTSVILGGSALTTPTIIGDSRPVPVGIEYAGNYNATFTPNSLITKSYADLVATDVHPKMAVNVATTGQTTLSTNQLIDGTMTTDGMRILVKDQTNKTENGIYLASASTWTRSGDFDFAPSGETVQGDLIPVITGATNRNTLWVLVEPKNYTGSSQNVVFTLFGSPTLTAGVGINILGSTVSVDGSALAGSYIVWSGNKFNVNANSIVSGYTTLTQFGNYTGSTQPILNAALTGATNGLGLSGRNVKLGGTLSEDTTISGNAGSYNLSLSGLNKFAVGFDCGGIITDTSPITSGLTYAACYHSGYVKRSLVDKEYVDKKISGTTSGSSIYLLASPSTVEVGGMPASTPIYGCRIDKMLEKILVKYLVPSFSSFSVNTPSIVEVGETISGSKTFSWSFANVGNVSGGTMCISETVPYYLITGNTSISSPKTANISSKSFSVCGELQRWCGSAKNTQGAQFNSGYHTTTALFPYYWGIVNAPGAPGAGRPSAANIVSLINASSIGVHKLLGSSDNIAGGTAIDFNSTGSDYMWVAIPSTVSKKLKWCVTPSNCGFIDGTVNPGGHLFPDPALDGAMGCTVTSASPVWSTTYNIYISNKQSENADPMGFVYV